jgi:hypothetical protein
MAFQRLGIAARIGAALTAISLTFWQASCSPPPRASGVAAPPRASAAPVAPPPASLFWRERFDGPSLDWRLLPGQSVEDLAHVFSVTQERAASFLHALHDARPGSSPVVPAVHYGKDFDPPLPLDRVRFLRWKWRVLQHPATNDDPWLDVAASLYVIFKTPSVLWNGRGFKFGWLQRPAPSGTFQKGIAQVALQTAPPSQQWKSEQVELCELYKSIYGPCEAEHLMYVGVLTDADGTRSVAEADYADFELLVKPGDSR